MLQRLQIYHKDTLGVADREKHRLFRGIEFEAGTHTNVLRADQVLKLMLLELEIVEGFQILALV